MFCGAVVRRLRGRVIASCGLTDTGCLRPENEDRILVDRELGLFIVADGMGGHSHGEVAAEMAVAAIRQYVGSSADRADVTWPFGYDAGLSLNENRLATAVRLANRQVWERSEEAFELAGMGTTVAAALIEDAALTIASVGDSRVYLFRAGELKALTIDDTWVGAMVRQGTLDESEAAQHPMRNVLTQAAGARSSIDVQTRELPLVAADLVLISTDGLHGVVDDRVLASVLVSAAGGQDLEAAAGRLVQAAREKSAPDNLSCILLRYGPAGRNKE